MPSHYAASAVVLYRDPKTDVKAPATDTHIRLTRQLFTLLPSCKPGYTSEGLITKSRDHHTCPPYSPYYWHM